MAHDELNDDVSALWGGTPRTTPLPAPAANFVPAVERMFTENCPSCRGSGRWGFRQDRTCFKCKGSGKLSFKTPFADRQKAKASAVARKARNAAESVECFKTEHPAVYEWCIESAPTFDFAAKMLEAVKKFGSLTDGQLAACYRGVERQAQWKARKAEAVTKTEVVNSNKLVEAFDKANKKAARNGQIGVWMKPLRLQSGEQSVVFTNGFSKWAGTIFVKSPDGKKLGMIRNGKFAPNATTTDTEQAAIVDCCNDPLKAALAFGKAWSLCACCGRTLTNDESIERGIGPICAETFGW